jgi:8-oxo-dGTP pyrophosphatase MutT (NUDIX family)
MPWAEDYHASVFVRGPDDQTLLITDLLRPLPQLWKFPGGGVEPEDNDPFDTAIREVEEETGVTIERRTMRLLESLNMGTYTMYFFEASTDNFEGFRKKSPQSELAGIFDIEELYHMVDFHPRYREVFLRAVGA